MTRAKALHVNQLAEKLREGSGLTRAMMAMNVLDQLQDVEGMEPGGEIRLVPDSETFTVLPWTPRAPACSAISSATSIGFGAPVPVRS